jgi:protein-S-isoprenylcysteine O-methyltransferase Ste14
MAYIDEMKQQGNWLFRRRSFSPIIILLLLLPAGLLNSTYLMGSTFIDHLWQLFCFGIALVGLGLRIYTVGYVPHGTSGRTTSDPKAKSLNTTGIYSIIRHPLYLSNFVVLIGISMLPHSALLTATCVLAFLLHYERIIIAEEAFLSEKFGDAFTQWAQKTPALIPTIGPWVKPNRSFSWLSVLRREYSGVLTVTVSFALINTFINWRREGKLRSDWLWLLVLGAGLIVFVAGWILRKTGVTEPPRKQAMET